MLTMVPHYGFKIPVCSISPPQPHVYGIWSREQQKNLVVSTVVMHPSFLCLLSTCPLPTRGDYQGLQPLHICFDYLQNLFPKFISLSAFMRAVKEIFKRQYFKISCLITCFLQCISKHYRYCFTQNIISDKCCFPAHLSYVPDYSRNPLYHQSEWFAPWSQVFPQFFISFSKGNEIRQCDEKVTIRVV